MITKPTSSLIDLLAREFGILSVIVLASMLLMNVRLHERQIERMHGTVIYTTNARKADAVRLADQLVAHRLFAGTPSTVRLDRVDGVHEVKLVVEPAAIDQPGIRQRLKNVFHTISTGAFGSDPAIVRLTDENFNAYDVLVDSSAPENPI